MAKQKVKYITIDTESKYELAKILVGKSGFHDPKISTFFKEIMDIKNLFIQAGPSPSDPSEEVPESQKIAKLKIDMNNAESYKDGVACFKQEDVEKIFESLNTLVSFNSEISEETIEKVHEQLFSDRPEYKGLKNNFSKMAQKDGVATHRQKLLNDEQRAIKNDPFYEEKTEEEIAAEAEKPRFLTENQRIHEEAILNNALVFTDGSVGTGKTFIACRVALDLLKEEKIEKIYLSRSPKGVGDSLGYLPGDKSAKMAEWLVPLYTELASNMPGKTYQEKERNMQKLVAEGKVEIQTLEHIRGRTLKNCVLIVDEAQNLTEMDLKAYVGRLGEGAKGVLIGDSKGQIDIKDSGFGFVVKTMRKSKRAKEEGIVVTDYGIEDIIRSPLVRVFTEEIDSARGLGKLKKFLSTAFSRVTEKKKDVPEVTTANDNQKANVIAPVEPQISANDDEKAVAVAPKIAPKL